MAPMTSATVSSRGEMRPILTEADPEPRILKEARLRGKCKSKATKALFDRAAQLRACLSGLKWLSKAKADLRGIPATYASWVATRMPEDLNEDQIRSCLLSGSCEAMLAFRGYVTEEILELGMIESPRTVIIHFHDSIPERMISDAIMDPRRLRAVASVPENLLSDRHVAMILERCPEVAAYCMCERLSREQIDYLVDNHPEASILGMNQEFLTSKNMTSLIRASSRMTSWYFNKRMVGRTLGVLITQNPREAKRFRHRMTPHQKKRLRAKLLELSRKKRAAGKPKPARKKPKSKSVRRGQIPGHLTKGSPDPKTA